MGSPPPVSGTVPGRRFNIAEGFRVALASVQANRVRSALTILGVSVGVAVVVLLAALVTGLRSSIQESFEASGPRNFVVTRFDFTAVRLQGAGNSRPPWWDHAEIVPEEADRLGRLTSVEEVLYNVPVTVTVDYDGRRLPNVRGQGYASAWSSYTQGNFISGRDFMPAEVRQSRAVAVLSDSLAQELFGTLDPIGRSIGLSRSGRDAREEFTVVGVFAPTPNVFTAVIKHWVVMPYTTALKRLKASDERAQILVVPRDSARLDQVKDEVIGLMRGMRGLSPRAENDFALIESAQILDLLNRFTAIFFAVLLGLTSAALMVGGVGVIGIMLISVTERTHEIGIRKAVGATRRDILWQFLVEAALLTVIGAALGMVVGGGLAGAVALWTPVPARVPLWSAASALGMAAVTGLLFGLVPAIRASGLDPVAALRHE